MGLAKNQIDENLLVTKLKSRNRDALGYLYDNYASALYGIISRIVSDENVAEEVLQDVFMKIWSKIDQYESSKGRLFTWMANLSRNLAIDKLRSKEIKKVGKTDNLETFVTEIERSHQNHQNIDSIGLKETLKSLREEERFIIEMTYFKGYTQSEVSEEFDIPLGTVKTRLRMGLKSLREGLNVR